MKTWTSVPVVTVKTVTFGSGDAWLTLTTTPASTHEKHQICTETVNLLVICKFENMLHSYAPSSETLALYKSLT